MNAIRHSKYFPLIAAGAGAAVGLLTWLLVRAVSPELAVTAFLSLLILGFVVWDYTRGEAGRRSLSGQ